MSRRFEAIARYLPENLPMPVRKTAGSAGYDIAAAENVELAPGVVTLVPTGVKAYMGPNEVLLLYLRSSLAVKYGLMLANGVGVIDSDYVDNASNEGHIQIALFNPTTQAIQLQKGQTIAQGVFTQFLVVDNDHSDGARTGGFGSTDHARSK